MEVAAELANYGKHFPRMIVSSTHAYFCMCDLEDVHAYEPPALCLGTWNVVKRQFWSSKSKSMTPRHLMDIYVQSDVFSQHRISLAITLALVLGPTSDVR